MTDIQRLQALRTKVIKVYDKICDTVLDNLEEDGAEGIVHVPTGTLKEMREMLKDNQITGIQESEEEPEDIQEGFSPEQLEETSQTGSSPALMKLIQDQKFPKCQNE